MLIIQTVFLINFKVFNMVLAVNTKKKNQQDKRFKLQQQHTQVQPSVSTQLC